MRNGRVENCFFAYNRAENDSVKDGHTIIVWGGELRNCTIVRNDAVCTAGVHAERNGKVRNCVMAEGTSASANVNAVCWGGTATCFDHCATDVEAINENCFSAPAIGFTDSANGDFTLAASSLCIDQGAELLEPEAEATDLLGAKRISGQGIDIGCYEFDSSAFSVGFSAEPLVAFAPAIITLTAQASGDDIGPAIDYYWTVRNGDTVIVSHDRSPVFQTTYAVPGLYDVTLCATNRETGETATATSSAVFEIGAKTLYVVNENPNAAFPFSTWETASATVHDAVDAALEGAEIVVSNGTYLLPRQIDLTKVLTLRGLTGHPEDVILKRSPNAGESRILRLNAGKEALVHGFTMTGGLGDGSNVRILAKGGCVSNCVIRNGRCSSKFDRGGGFLLESEDGLVTHCVISNNTSTAAWDNGSTHGTAADVLAGRFEHSLVTGNLPSHLTNTFCQVVNVGDGTVRFCTIVNNVSTNCAGVNCMGEGIIENCIIAGNRTAQTNKTYAVFGALRHDYRGLFIYPERSNEFVRCATDQLKLNDTCLRSTPEALYAAFDEGDYHHKRHSPAIDKVLPEETDPMPEIDLDGKPRLEHRRYDLGCYEMTYVTPGTMLMLR